MGVSEVAVQQMEVQLAVGVEEEYRLAVVATLGDVVRGSWQNAIGIEILRLDDREGQKSAGKWIDIGRQDIRYVVGAGATGNRLATVELLPGVDLVEQVGVAVE